MNNKQDISTAAKEAFEKERPFEFYEKALAPIAGPRHRVRDLWSGDHE